MIHLKALFTYHSHQNDSIHKRYVGNSTIGLNVLGVNVHYSLCYHDVFFLRFGDLSMKENFKQIRFNGSSDSKEIYNFHLLELFFYLRTLKKVFKRFSNASDEAQLENLRLFYTNLDYSWRTSGSVDF